MSRRHWALPLFAAAVVVFWGGLLLSGTLFPERGEKRVYEWPADAAAVRQVVVEGEHNHVSLIWSATETPRLETEQPGYAVPELLLVVQGDALHVRANPAARPAGSPQRRYRYGYRAPSKLYLPMQVQRVVGDTLRWDEGDAPERAELVGSDLSVNTTRLQGDIAELRLTGVRSRCRGYSSGIMTLDAAKVRALAVDALGGSVKLNNLSQLESVPLHGPDELELTVGRMTDVHKLKLAPLTAAREAELHAVSAQAHLRDPDEDCKPPLTCKKPEK